MFTRRRRLVSDDRRRRWVRRPSQIVVRREDPGTLGKAPPRTIFGNDTRSNMREFQHIKKIGEGAQGRCDLVQRKGDGKCFVYKQMKGEVDFTRSKGTNKPLEVAILRDILGKSDRILKLHEYSYVSPTNNCFYFEHCSYGDLFNMIDCYHNKVGLAIPESFIWHTYLQLAEALTFIQEGVSRRTTRDNLPIGWTAPSPGHRSIVHRDIKPDNIFLRPGKTWKDYPEIVLADFGLATTELYSCEEDDDFCGTLAYQGPELPLHSRAGDTYAIGACIHHMATGMPPIKKVPKNRLLRWWLFKPEARGRLDVTLTGYSRELDDAMHKTMRKYPEDRLKGKALVESLERSIGRWDGDCILLKPWL